MKLSNIAKHLLHLARTEYGFENSATTSDEIFAAEQLFEVVKSFSDNYFSEMYTYDTLEFEDEYDEMTDEEENDENDDYDDNDHFNLKTGLH